MTTAEYKEKYPHHAHLEGDALWNAMEDTLLRSMPCVPQEDIVLSAEDEEEYQIAKKADEEYWVAKGAVSANYTRRFWQDWDKVQPLPEKPPTSGMFILFDVSEEGSTKCWDIEGNEYSSIQEMMDKKKQ